MPLADISRVIPRIIKRHGNRRNRRIQWRRRLRHPILMRISTRHERAAKRRAPRRTGNRAVKTHALACEIVDIRRKHIGITPIAQCVCAVLIPKNPDDIGFAYRTKRKLFTHRKSLSNAHARDRARAYDRDKYRACASAGASDCARPPA